LVEHLAYQSKPLPEVIGQDEAQYLEFSSETTFPETAYPTKKMTIKYRYVPGLEKRTKGPTLLRTGSLTPALRRPLIQRSPKDPVSLQDAQHVPPPRIHLETF